MADINILDKSVYNRIAAGEVVERPSSVVKELVENSIDAGADEIYVNVSCGGKNLIEVFDNGSGMNEENLKKCLLAHATSKIKDTDDLERISTLGFRGEALPSIASVSKMRITTKTEKDEIGLTLTQSGGVRESIEQSPCATGTFVTVTDLFYNTPARRKFLKTDRSEENEISDMISRLMLANPNVAFKYCVDGGVIFQSYGDGEEDALLCVYGTETLNNSFRISRYVNGINIRGYIGNHNFTKPNRTYQTVILNGRYVVNATIQSAIHNAYMPYLMKRRYPFYVLYVNVPEEVVDVNVTPNKSDVRFADSGVVYSALFTTVSNVLDGTDKAVEIIKNLDDTADNVLNSPFVTKQIEIQRAKNELNKHENEFVYKKDVFPDRCLKSPLSAEKCAVSPETIEKFANAGCLSDFDKSLLGITDDDLSEKEKNSDDIFFENKRYIKEQEEKRLKETAEQQKIEIKRELRFVGQTLNSFLIFDDGVDLFIVDQHAAHERLLFNKLDNKRKNGEKSVQELLVPYDISLNPLENDAIFDKIGYLEDLGFDVKLKSDGLEIYAIPADLTDIDISEFISDVTKDGARHRSDVPEVIYNRIATMACKAAVKAGMPLSENEVNALMKLLDNDINLKCPHGRPIAVKITRYEIDKWFKRIV